MTEMVSSAAIGGMAVTLLASIGIPVAALFVARKKIKGKMFCALIGAGTFVVFALILEQLLHQVMIAAFGGSLTGNIWFYALYGGLAAGVFEETGRLLSMKFLMKKTLSKENSVMYGIGHGGAESVILIGLTYISNIVTAVMINAGMLDSILSDVAGIERAAAFALQICLSYIVYRAVKEKKPAFYFFAVALHFIADAGVILLAQAVSIYVAECVLIVAVICLSVVVFSSFVDQI